MSYSSFLGSYDSPKPVWKGPKRTFFIHVKGFHSFIQPRPSMTDELAGTRFQLLQRLGLCPVDGVCKRAACPRMWELSGCAKPLDAHMKYPLCPSPPLIEGSPGASFTWRFPHGSKERCLPAVVLGIGRHFHAKSCARHTPMVMAVIFFVVLHMRGKEGGGRRATLKRM